YGLRYVCTNDRATFQTAFQQSMTGNTPTLIEVQTDGASDQQQQQTLTQQVLATIVNAPMEMTAVQVDEKLQDGPWPWFGIGKDDPSWDQLFDDIEQRREATRGAY
ncbi:MAG: hypothetical protein R3E79_62615, partial [Caldilineaceae bacterium]